MGDGRFEAVFVDFYGTICSGDRDVVESVCRRIVDSVGLEMTATQFAVTWDERFFATVEQSNHAAFQTLFECEMASLRATFDALDLASDPGPFVADLEDYWRNPPVYDDAVEFLQDHFSTKRLLFASDAAPVLPFNTMKQTIEMLRTEYHGFSKKEIQDIYYNNAARIIRRRQG